MAQLFLQVADVRAGAISRARSVHPVDENEKYAALDDGRRVNHASGLRVLRLNRSVAAPGFGERVEAEFAGAESAGPNPRGAEFAGHSRCAGFFFTCPGLHTRPLHPKA